MPLPCIRAQMGQGEPLWRASILMDSQDANIREIDTLKIVRVKRRCGF